MSTQRYNVDRPMYVRMAVGYEGSSTERRAGIFRGLRMLRYHEYLRYDDEQRLDDLTRWFNRHLPAPRRLRTSNAIFWFKSDVFVPNTEMWHKAREIRELYEMYHLHVAEVRTVRPGKIVYHDEHQIAAVPFSDTFEMLI